MSKALKKEDEGGTHVTSVRRVSSVEGTASAKVLGLERHLVGWRNSGEASVSTAE